MSRTRPTAVIDHETRLKAMREFVGSRKVTPDAPSAQQEVRALRKSHRRMNQYMPEPESTEPESGSK